MKIKFVYHSLPCKSARALKGNGGQSYLILSIRHQQEKYETVDCAEVTPCIDLYEFNNDIGAGLLLSWVDSKPSRIFQSREVTFGCTDISMI